MGFKSCFPAKWILITKSCLLLRDKRRDEIRNMKPKCPPCSGFQGLSLLGTHALYVVASLLFGCSLSVPVRTLSRVPLPPPLLPSRVWPLCFSLFTPLPGVSGASAFLTSCFLYRRHPISNLVPSLLTMSSHFGIHYCGYYSSFGLFSWVLFLRVRLLDVYILLSLFFFSFFLLFFVLGIEPKTSHMLGKHLFLHLVSIIFITRANKTLLA